MERSLCLDSRKIIYLWTNLRISFDSHWVDPGLKHPDHLRANLFFTFFMLHKLCITSDYWTERGNNTILKSAWNYFRYCVCLYTSDDNEETDDWPASCLGEIQLECSWRNVWTRWRQSNGRKGGSAKNIETWRTSESPPFLGKKILGLLLLAFYCCWHWNVGDWSFIFKVHYAIADLYCSGWYMDMITESAEFHLKLSAVKFKNLKGMYVYGQKLLGLDTDELEDLELEKVRLWSQLDLDLTLTWAPYLGC